MYVDETGTPQFLDSPRYFLLTGIVVNDYDIKKIKKAVFDFKLENFDGTYIESEIHMHEMFLSKKAFRTLRGDDKERVIGKLYDMINDLPFKVIATAINKPLLQIEQPKWSVLKTAFIILASRYNQYLNSIGEGVLGIIRMDDTTDRQRSEIKDILKMLRKEKKNNQVSNISVEPYFVNSDAVEGVQVADAVSYCIGKKLLGNPKFPLRFWDMISKKIHANEKGEIMGYGLNVFPYMKELEGEDIQP